MIKSLLVYIHIFAVVASAGLTLWLLHDLWFVMLAVIIILTFMLAAFIPNPNKAMINTLDIEVAPTPRNNNLLLHCGANTVERRAVYQTPTPDSTDTWFPMPHRHLLEEVESQLWGSGLEIKPSGHASMGVSEGKEKLSVVNFTVITSIHDALTPILAGTVEFMSSN